MPTNLLDISYWQGALDFSKIKAAGYNYLIIRAGYGTTKDERFDEYATNCKNYGIKFGVYWFCYATNISEVKNEAKKCAEVISPYTIDLPVFYDFEYDTVTKAQNKGITLGKNECSQFTITFCDEMKRYGYTPGYYANTDYYQNYYTDAVKNKGYVFWLAHYKNDYSYHEPPYQCDFFQWTSRGTIQGISGVNFDVDVCFTEKYLNCRNIKNDNVAQNSNPITSTKHTKQDAINAVINVARGEIGYLEKKSNSQLDNKTANAGSGNYTKYWRDLWPQLQAQAWCAIFVTWCFVQVFGIDATKVLLKHYPYTYCPTLGSLFTKYANPEVGDIVIFYRNGTFAHTGIVTYVNGDYFETIEGNTSGASGIIENGGGVCAKSYYNSQLPGTKFCRVDWEYAANHMDGNTTSSGTNSTVKPKKFVRTNSGTVKVNTSLNVRSTPGGTVIGQVYNGNRFDVDENQTIGDWLYVKFATVGTGYINSEYVELDKKSATPTEPSKPSSENNSSSSSNTSSNNSSSSKPTTTTKTISYKIKAKDTITSIAKEYGMTVNDLAKLNGFTQGKTIKVKQTVSNEYERWTGVVTASELNVRQKPGVDQPLLIAYPLLRKGNQVDVFGEETGTDGDLWYYIRIANKHYGYVHSDYLTKE